VTAVVHGTGVALRLAADDEVRAVESARRGREFVLTPSRSLMFTSPGGPLNPDEVLVVSQAFVEFASDDASERCHSYEHHGHTAPTNRDATMELLELAEETFEDLTDIFADMRIAKLGVSRWDFMSAPRRIGLDPGLVDRLAPLRRG
jgi:hypothetical protein